MIPKSLECTLIVSFTFQHFHFYGGLSTFLCLSPSSLVEIPSDIPSNSSTTKKFPPLGISSSFSGTCLFHCGLYHTTTPPHRPPCISLPLFHTHNFVYLYNGITVVQSLLDFRCSSQFFTETIWSVLYYFRIWSGFRNRLTIFVGLNFL